MLFTFFLVGCIIGSAVTRQADIDINRIKLLPNEVVPPLPEYSTHSRTHPASYYQFKRSNDYDYSGSRHTTPLSAVQSLHGASEIPITKSIAVHQPREDPRLFYQSDSYIQEINRKNMNREVSMIYPGRDVVRADERFTPRSLAMRWEDRSANKINPGYNLCVKCPQDRTLIAKPGSDRVVLQYPRLSTCSGLKVPRDLRFTRVYGPSFGSLLSQGLHVIIGHISYKNKQIQMCKMQVHVIVQQSCSVPSYLITQCNERSKLCSFSCRDPSLELQGHSALICGDTLGWTEWTGRLPVCRARSWCERPEPPDHGRLSCKGSPEGSGLAEGSTCRVRCARGWHWTPRAATVCRRGAWTFDIACQPKRNYPFGNSILG